MATNAPYFQLRSPHGQFTNGTNASFTSVDNHDYDTPTALAENHHGPLYPESHAPAGSVIQSTTINENHNLIELVEAATTAAGEAKARDMESHSARISGGEMPLARGKRKRRSSSPPAEEGSDTVSHNQGAKRARVAIPTDPQLSRNSSENPPSTDTIGKDVRPASIHSAAALFRHSSKESPRKYTRPPMSKLFISLQLTPENFLHLQARAKAYMLDRSHPERQSCVGNRGKGDNDMVKLRLFNCVRDFLNEGAGNQFFGENVEKPAQKDAIDAARALGEEKVAEEAKLVWPRDGNKIISLVTPLLRRMVTNERQRMYAIETRKVGKKQEDSAEAANEGSDAVGGPGAQMEQLHISLQDR